MKMENTCFLCGSHKFKKLFRAGDYWILCCRACGMVISADKYLKKLSRSATKIYSSKDYVENYRSLAMQKTLKERASQRLEEIEAFVDGRRLLDVGCSYGTFLEVANKRGWKVEGIEPCRKTTQFLKKNTSLKVSQKTLKELEPKRQFDVISYWDVLEHIPNPKAELREVKKRLNKEGLLALQVPNFGSLSSRLAKERFGWLCPEDHLNHFTPQTLKILLEASGFKIIKITTWTGIKNHFLAFFNDLFPERGFIRPVRFIFLKIGILLDKLFPFLGNIFGWLQSRLGLGGLIVVYAKKLEKI